MFQVKAKKKFKGIPTPEHLDLFRAGTRWTGETLSRELTVQFFQSCVRQGEKAKERLNNEITAAVQEAQEEKSWKVNCEDTKCIESFELKRTDDGKVMIDPESFTVRWNYLVDEYDFEKEEVVKFAPGGEDADVRVMNIVEEFQEVLNEFLDAKIALLKQDFEFTPSKKVLTLGAEEYSGTIGRYNDNGEVIEDLSNSFKVRDLLESYIYYQYTLWVQVEAEKRIPITTKGKKYLKGATFALENDETVFKNIGDYDPEVQLVVGEILKHFGLAEHNQ